VSTSPQQKKTDPPSPAIVDEFGKLDAELALLEPKIKKHKALEKQILACYEDSPPGEDFQAHGEEFTAVIGARGNRRKIVDMAAVLKRMGKAIFFKLCDMPLGKLDAIIPEQEQKGIVVWEQSGSRSVKVVTKTEPKKA
jgi:hypothetical protein